MMPLQVTPVAPGIDWETLQSQIQAGATVFALLIAVASLWLNLRQAAKLKILEADLDKAKFEHQTQFAKLHEKRAEVIQEIYRRIVILELWIKHVFAETKLPDEEFTSPEGFAEVFEDVFGHISLSLQDLAAYFNLNRLFLDEDLCEKIVDFHDVLMDEAEPVYGFFYQRFRRLSEDKLRELYGGNLEDRAIETLELVSESRRAIEREFRELLGIRQRSQNDDESIDYDLMWIPQPGTIDPLRWPIQHQDEVVEPGREETNEDENDKLG